MKDYLKNIFRQWFNKSEFKWKKKFKIEGFLKDLFYDGEKVNYPITVTFITKVIQQKYNIFTQKYFDEIYEKMNFKNTSLLIGNIYEKYKKDKISLFSHF